MPMIIHDVVQGSPEWHALRAAHFTASEAPALMGVSPYLTRTELLSKKADPSVVDAEIDAHKAALFAAGHAAEAAYRPLAEDEIGDDLYPVTGTREVDGLPLLASFDGLTLDNQVGFEHKLLSKKIVAHIDAHGEPGPAYYWQLEHQLLVSGGQRILFVTSNGTDDGAVRVWYESASERRAALTAAWKQFEIDLASFVPEAPRAAPVVAAPQETLPAVSVRVDGSLAIISNLPDFGVALRSYIERIPAEPSTDQEFADTEAACKALKRTEDALEAAENNALAQLTDVDTMRRLVADYRALARSTRLQREKLVTQRKEQIRGEIVAGGVAALRDHIAALNQRLGKTYMPMVPADFAGVIKGKRTIESLRDAVNTELARAKIAANEAADRIQVNLNTLRDLAGAHAFLFADTPTIVLKAADDLTTLVKARIAEHDAKEAAKLEAQRERIRAEEQEKARRDAEAAAAQREQERQAEIARAALLVRQEAEAKAAAEDQARRDQLIQAEQEAQTGIAEARAEGGLPAPLLDALSDTAAFVRADAVADIDTRQAIATALRAPAPAAAAPAAEEGPANLLIGAINDRLGFTVNAAFLATLGFQPARVDGARRFYRDGDLPRIGRAIAEHTLRVTQPLTV